MPVAISLPVHAPYKAKKGQPCNGCGYCCAAEVCEVGLAMFGENQPAPCPAMEFDESGRRFNCGVVRMAGEISPMYAAYLKLKLGIGMGCDSNDLEEDAPCP